MEVLGMSLKTDPNVFNGDKSSLMDLAGYQMTKNAAAELYAKTKISPDQVCVCELHDCFSANELVTYEAL